MKMTVRAFNDAGVARFRDFLEELRTNGDLPVPFEYLEDPALTSSVDGFAEVDSEVVFASRLEAGRYFCDTLAGINETEQGKVELWAWLSLLFFDQVCPVSPNGFRKAGEDYRYIPSGGFGKGAHRHLLKIPFMIFKAHGLVARVMLVSDLTKPGNINEEISSRQKFISNRSILAVLEKLYYDSDKNGIKRGIDDKKKVLTKKGSLRRFVQVMQQFELTYDLYSMPAESMVNLLPDDFDVWLAKKP
jgi:hypothetical protein